MKAHTILNTIGNTPHVRIQRLFGADANVWIKSERSNPGGSIKDRIALAMVEAAEKSGALQPGATIIEPTSGNTGIGLAMVAAVKGYKLILVMPDSMSIERRRLMLAYGASFDLTPREKGMKGAIARAQELVAATPGAWMPQQFENPANVEVHTRTTALEILADFPEGLDAIIAEAPAEAPAAEQPNAQKPGFLARALGRAASARVLDDAMLESLEELLIQSDMGVETAMKVAAALAEVQLEVKRRLGL